MERSEILSQQGEAGGSKSKVLFLDHTGQC